MQCTELQVIGISEMRLMASGRLESEETKELYS